MHTVTTDKLESASESDTDSEESVGRIMLEQVGRIQNEQEENTIYTTISIKGQQSAHTRKKNGNRHQGTENYSKQVRLKKNFKVVQN